MASVTSKIWPQYLIQIISIEIGFMHNIYIFFFGDIPVSIISTKITLDQVRFTSMTGLFSTMTILGSIMCEYDWLTD